MARLGIAVPSVTADLQFLGVLVQLTHIFPKPLVMPLLRALVVSAPVDEVCFIELPESSVLLQHLGQILWGVFRVCRDGNAAGSQFRIEFFKQCGYLCKQAVTRFLCGLLPHPLIFICICFELRSVNVQVVEVDMLLSKYLAVQVVEQFFHGRLEHIVDEIAERPVRWGLVLHEIHETKVDTAIVLELAQ